MIKFQWSWPEKEHIPSIYLSKSYYEIFSKAHQAEPRCLSWERPKGGNAWLPLMYKKLSLKNNEVFSSYGYGGLITDKNHIAEDEYDQLREFLRSNKISALFIRHSPILNNSIFWPKSALELNRITYITKLYKYKSFSERLLYLKQKVRWSVNHSIKKGYKVKLYKRPDKKLIKDFYDIYLLRMKSKETNPFYFFNYEIIESHFFNLEEKCDLVSAFDSKGNLVAGALILLDKFDTVHYHLSACNQIAMKDQVIEHLLVKSFDEYANLGYKFFRLGGGSDVFEKDGLSRFKKKFSDTTDSFFISKIICDEELYESYRREVSIKQPNIFLNSDAKI